MSASSATSSAPVAIVKATPTARGVLQAVSDAMEAVHWRDLIERSEPVALKPNLGWDKLLPGATSAPWVVDAVVRVLSGHVGQIFLVEADQVAVRAEDGLRVSGLARVVADRGLTWVNMSRGSFRRVRDPQRLVLRDVMIPEILTRTQVITLPVMKTHNKSTISGALKNQWGCLETLRHNFHPVLSEALVDVNTIVRPRLAVMDGTIGLEGDGPKSGCPREVGVVLASSSLGGIDACAARTMGFDPTLIPHLALAESHGLGSLSPPLTAQSVPVGNVAVRFRPARHNAVSFTEGALRKPVLEQLVFRTPLLRLACFMARRYYDSWYAMVGRGELERFLRESPYAAQWSASGVALARPTRSGGKGGARDP